MKKKLRIIGMIIGIFASVLAWTIYGWELALIIFLAECGNNLEQQNK